MAQQTAMQTLISWGDEMLLKHPQKILSFGEAIDKAVELLQMEKEQIEKAWWAGHDERDANHMIYPSEDCNQYYNGTHNK